jgi:hypothetical protein
VCFGVHGALNRLGAVLWNVCLFVCLLGLYFVNQQDACGANCLEEDYKNPLSVAGA